MNLTKFLKGCTTMGELENMPNSYSHTIFKQYTEMLKSKEAQEAVQGEEIVEDIEDNMT